MIPSASAKVPTMPIFRSCVQSTPQRELEHNIMRIVVASCWKYRDTWTPFFTLWQKFWPGCPFEVTLLTDEMRKANTTGVAVFATNKSWCGILCDWLDACDDLLVLLLQDDFFLNAPINPKLIAKALDELVERHAAMIRLYPCPGADEDIGDLHFGRISKNARYRTSLQATIWRKDALHAIASQFNTPQEFELEGSKLSNCMDQEFLALKRDCPQPWPISYECTAIVRGKWQQSALDLCAQHGIEVDTSMREVA